MVCHITCAHKPDDTRIFHKECKTLAKNGFNTHLLAYSDHEDELLKDGVTLHLLKREKAGRINRMLFSAHRIYQEAKKLKADLYHIHDPELLPYALLLKHMGAAVVYDAHEDVPRQILNKYWILKPIRGIIAWGYERFENFAAKRLNGIVAATPYISDRFLKVNANTIDICNYPLLAEFENSISENNRKNTICYVGAISGNRGIITMLDVLQNLDTRLILCGDFETEELKNQAMNHPAWRKVDFLGYVNRQAIEKVMNEALVGLCLLKPLPNYIDSLPIKLFEYMASSLPVVASDFPLWKSIVEDSGCGICVEPGNIAAITSAVDTLLKDTALAHAMGARGRQAVLSKFSFHSEYSKLEKLYLKLLNK